MPAANAFATEGSLVTVTLDPRQLDAVVIAHDSLAGTMTRQQAHELLWALEATLGGDTAGTDDDDSCGDPDCPRPHLCEVPPLRTAGCGDPDCSCPECPTGRANAEPIDLGPKTATCAKCGEELVSSTGLPQQWLTAKLAGHPGSSFCGTGWHEAVTA